MLKLSLGLKHIEDHAELRKELEYITKSGFDTADVDISMRGQLEMLHDCDCIARAKKSRKILDEYGMKIYQGHSPFNLHKFDDPEYDCLRDEEVMLSLPVVAELGIEYTIVHPFFCFNLNDPLFLQREKLLEKNIQMFTKYVNRAKELGVKICTENMFAMNAARTESFRTYFSGPEEMNQLMDAVPGLTFCLDTGHALVGHFDLEKMVYAFGNRLSALHVHHNNRCFDQHLAPFQQYSTDWTGFCKALKQTGYQGTLNLEVGDFTAYCPEEMKEASYHYLYTTARTLANMVEKS